MKIRIIALLSALLVPSFLYATTGPLGTLVDLSNTLATGVVTSLGYLMFTLAVVAFLWGMVQFIWNARSGDAGKGVENGKQFMLWGLIALFVMFSVWGIIKFTQGVFNIQGQTSIIIPNIKVLGSSPSPTGGTVTKPVDSVVATCYDATTGKNGTKDSSGNCIIITTSNGCYNAATGKSGQMTTAGCVPDGTPPLSSGVVDGGGNPSGLAYNGACLGYSKCGSGLTCQKDLGVCKKDPTESCSSDSECASLRCDIGIGKCSPIKDYGGPCNGNTQCRANEYCKNTLCVRSITTNEKCDEDYQCQPLKCLADYSKACKSKCIPDSGGVKVCKLSDVEL